MSAQFWNLDAEQGVLGAILYDNQILERLPSLKPTQFYDPLHGWLYAECAMRILDGRLADPTSLRDICAIRFADVGGAGYLLRLVENAAKITAQAVEYARLIADLAAKREMERVLRDALADMSAGKPALAILGDTESALRTVEAASDLRFGDLPSVLEACLAAPPGLATGFPSLDRRLGGLHKGDLILLAARPSMGKSAVARNIAMALAWRGYKIHFASLEMSTAQLAARTVSAMSFEGNAPFPYIAIRRHDPDLDRAQIRALGQRIPKTIAVDDRPAQTLTMLESAARATRREMGGLDAIFVDYLQIMRTETREGRVQQVTEISAGLKAIAKRLDVPVVALSQLSRANEAREDKRPMLADLRDSGSLEQDADAVIGVYREAYYLERAEPQGSAYVLDKDYEMAMARWAERLDRVANDLELITLKQRHGAAGTDRFTFHAPYDVILEAPK